MIALSDTVVSAPVAANRPRYQTLPVWQPYSSLNSTGRVTGGNGLRLVVRSATVQPESSKSGAASGASACCRQPVSAGRSTAAGPGRDPASEPLEVGWVVTGDPLTVTAWPLAKTSIGPACAVSARSATVPRRLPADRSSAVPRTSTGPSAVSARQNCAAVSSVPSRSSSGRRPPSLTSTRASPPWV